MSISTIKESSEAWAFEKAKIWAVTLQRDQSVVEYKRGKYDCCNADNLIKGRIAGTVTVEEASS